MNGEQLPLVAPIARRRTSPSPREGAVDAGRAELALQVLELVRHYAGRTSFELAEIGSIDPEAVSRRLRELARQGLVFKGRAAVCRRRGRRAASWWPRREPPASWPGT